MHRRTYTQAERESAKARAIARRMARNAKDARFLARPMLAVLEAFGGFITRYEPRPARVYRT